MRYFDVEHFYLNVLSDRYAEKTLYRTLFSPPTSVVNPESHPTICYEPSCLREAERGSLNSNEPNPSLFYQAGRRKL
jgi:hypothetical protein